MPLTIGFSRCQQLFAYQKSISRKFIAHLDDKVAGESIEEVKEAVKRKGTDPRLVVIDYMPKEDIIFII